MKEGDLVMVSAEAVGLGKPMEAVIDKIETFMVLSFLYRFRSFRN